MPTSTGQRLSVTTKVGYSLAEYTLSLSLSALSLFYLLFLTEVGGLRPALAGLVLLVGRTVDAFFDPLMGRITDVTRMRAGRRRPWFLIGALPFAAAFAGLFLEIPATSQLARFAYYAAVYLVWTLCSTVLTVPYMALLPELTLDYQERTALSIYRSAAGQIGTAMAALGTQPLVRGFGGGAEGWLAVGLGFGAMLGWPWLLTFLSTRERPDFQRPPEIPFFHGLGLALRHRAYRDLMGLYVCSRIAMDIAGALLVFYFTYWLARPDDFELTMGMMLATVVASLPFWLRASHGKDKRTLFVAGSIWWFAVMLCFVPATAEWPRWLPILLGGLAGAGYAAADVVPWSMLADVVDADELRTTERREGLYSGFFFFLRKLGGAVAVFLAGIALDLAGFVRGGGAAQPESALQAIRILTGVAPALFIALSILLARAYPISRERHAAIRGALDARRDPEDVRTP